MSDFIFSGAGTPYSDLKHELDHIYQGQKPTVLEFQGSWGTLAVTQNHYFGFDPVETDTHLAVVVGGPLLLFRDNRFLTGSDPGAPPSPTAGTRALLERWERGLLNWHNNISGPFAALFIDKKTQQIELITDLLSFIPVYASKVKDAHYISTHVDALARITRKEGDLDLCSQVDFVLHGSITYPYTAYRNVWQLAPGSIHKLTMPHGQLQSRTYWLPREVEHYRDIKEPVMEFRKTLESYIQTLTLGMERVGMFLTAGEVSRVVASVVPGEVERDAFVIQDSSKGEGHLAGKAARAFKFRLTPLTRRLDDYIDSLPEVTELVGSGTRFIGVPAYGVHHEYELDQYPAILGGLFGGVLFKGSCIKKTLKSQKYPFVTQQKDLKYTPDKLAPNDLFDAKILAGVQRRREEHFERIRRFRNKSAAEWFHIWPSSMNRDSAQWAGNRRLLRSYEPLMSHEMVQLSSVLPQEWKLNHQFFHRATKPYLKPVKWLEDADGRRPYFANGANKYFTFKNYLKARLTRNRAVQHREFPWVDISLMVRSDRFKKDFGSYDLGSSILHPAFSRSSLRNIQDTEQLDDVQKLSLLQLLHFNSSSQNNRRPELVYVRKMG